MSIYGEEEGWDVVVDNNPDYESRYYMVFCFLATWLKSYGWLNQGF